MGFFGPRIAAAVIIAVLALSSSAPAHQLPAGFNGFEDPAACGGCHKEIYDEWASSMHSKSSKFEDKFHAAVYGAFSKAMIAAGKPAPYFCANCHTPTADNMAKLLKGEAAPDAANPTNARGVTCSFCHHAGGIVEGERFHAYSIQTGILGPDAASTAPHGAGYSEFASSYKVCMGCHGKMLNGKGAVICSSDEEGVSDCLSCHMEERDGGPAAGSAKTRHHYHGMPGGHDDAMLKKGATVEIGSELGRLLVFVKNPNPHFFPSTNPMRLAYLKVEIFDAAGKTLFTNYEKDPYEDKAAMMVRVFKAGDRTGVPSWDADGTAKDTRLKPKEDRQFTYKLPEGAVRATAKLYYRFVPAMAMEKFGIAPDGTVENPRLVSETEIKL